MHPSISYHSSKLFYDGKIVDGPDIRERRTAPWHSTGLPPFAFYDVNGQESTKYHSFLNSKEVDVVCDLIKRLLNAAGKGKVYWNIAVCHWLALT